MLAELAIASASFKIIKQCVLDSGDLLNAGKAISDYFGAEQKIAKQVENGTGDIMAAFQAKKDLAKKEEELRWLLNKESLMGYHQWLEFKAQYYRDQKENEKELARARHKRQAAIEANITVAIKAFGIIFIIMVLVFGGLIYMKKNPVVSDPKIQPGYHKMER
jgi:Skp family chaperone for outer membrane proteins|tara:strand:+ start:1091 stop:1579 length:489 start_codon:yes stop_codon:yes gene_type:complete